MTRRVFFLFLGVTIFASFILFFRLGERPLRNPDEGRYADIAHEMVESGDWVKPTVFGIGYLRKPPFFHWLVAGSFRIFGENELAARAVPALFGLMTVWLLFFFSRRFFNERGAVFGALILATNVWQVQVSRYLLIDAVFSFFITACLFLFYAALQSTTRRKTLLYLFYLSLGLAFLTKGPASVATVGFSILVYLAVARRLGEIRRMELLPGVIIFSAVALPWFFLLDQREPGYLAFFFGHENVARFTSSEFEHQEGWYYYLAVLPLVFMPWTAYFRPWRETRPVDAKEKDATRYLLISAGAIALFYSLSRSKLPTYILPCLPLLAAASGNVWARWTASEPRLRASEYAPVIIMMMAAVTAMISAPYWHATHASEYPAAIVGHIQWLGGACLACGVICLRALRRREPARLFTGWALMLTVICFLVPPLMETMNPYYTTKAFATELKGRLSPTDEVFVFDHPGPFYDFEFYLDHPVRPIGLEGELEHSRGDKNASEIALTRERFFQRLRDNEKLYVMMRRSDFSELDPALKAHLSVLKEDVRKVLVVSGGAL